MTNAIDPVRCADEIISILQRLTDNVSGGFEILPIENDPLHATVRVLVLHKRSEELGGHALEKSVWLALFGLSVQCFDARHDHVGRLLPFGQPS
jgi:hypothetical protein